MRYWTQVYGAYTYSVYGGWGGKAGCQPRICIRFFCIPCRSAYGRRCEISTFFYKKKIKLYREDFRPVFSRQNQVAFATMCYGRTGFVGFVKRATTILRIPPYAAGCKCNLDFPPLTVRPQRRRTLGVIQFAAGVSKLRPAREFSPPAPCRQNAHTRGREWGSAVLPRWPFRSYLDISCRLQSACVLERSKGRSDRSDGLKGISEHFLCCSAGTTPSMFLLSHQPRS